MQCSARQLKKNRSRVRNIPLQYRPSLATSLVFLLLLGGCVFLFLGRHDAGLRSLSINNVLPEYHTHISNFVISYGLVAGIGYMWLMLGVPFRVVLLLGAVALAANWIYELFIPVLNVPDALDAWFGTVGTLVGLVVLLLIKRFGLRPMKPAQV